VEDGIYKTWDLTELEFEKILRTDFSIVWTLVVEDTGTRHLKENLTEEEQAETGNFIKNFYITINGDTYRSYQHPFVDDGCKVSAKIYGTKAEKNFKEGIRGITFSRVLGVVSIGGFKHNPGLNPHMFHDSVRFIEQFRYHANNVSSFPIYDEFWVIDYDDDYTDEDDWRTHSCIYKSTVTSLLNNIDTCTDGNSRVVLLIGSHGIAWPITPGFLVFDSWAGGIVGGYYHNTLANKIDDITSEGTKVFYWAGSCYSKRMRSELRASEHHNNHLIDYVYTKKRYCGARNYEFRGFFDDGINDSHITRVESLFPYARDAFLDGHPNDDMEMWDDLSGSFYL